MQMWRVAVCLVLAIMFWRRPVAYIPPAMAWPLASWLSQPHAQKFMGSGVITILPWLSLTQRASAAVVKGIVQLVQDFRE